MTDELSDASRPVRLAFERLVKEFPRASDAQPLKFVGAPREPMVNLKTPPSGVRRIGLR
jgi:hypothetical protein